MVYGANGYTGRLVALAAKREGLRPVLAGPIEEVPFAHRRRRIDFTGGSAMTIAVAWGDMATALVSTGIPNIEVYARAPRTAAIAGRALGWRPRLPPDGRGGGGAAAVGRLHQPSLLMGACCVERLPARALFASIGSRG